MVQSVRLSVCLFVRMSVCLPVCTSVHPSVTPLSLCSHHRIIMNFLEFIANDRIDVHAEGQGQMSKFRVTEVKIQFSRFRTVTPVWIHIWRWNDTRSLVLLGRGALLLSRSSVKFQGRTTKEIVDFYPNWAFADCNSSLNSPMAMKWCTKVEVA